MQSFHFRFRDREAQEIAVVKLRPFDAEAFTSKLIDYATIEPDEDAHNEVEWDPATRSCRIPELQVF